MHLAVPGALVGGVLADRFGRTLIIQLSNVTGGLTHLAIAALVITDTAEIWQLAVLTAINGVAAAAWDAFRSGSRSRRVRATWPRPSRSRRRG